jgi:predicted nucleotidyltransferase
VGGGITDDVRREAGRRLDAIAADEGVRIFLAVESGSRAWGFPSPDSDYDVRFLYVRPLADYLKLDPPRDVIERPIEGLWDVNGWDLRKALLLLRSGNAVLVEWLCSPLIYREESDLAERLRGLAKAFANPRDAVRHYYGQMNGVYARDFGQRPAVKLKKYLYVVRCASALSWLRQRWTLPPMALGELLDGGAAPAKVVAILGELLREKAQASELGEGPRIPVLDAFIEDQLAWACDSGALAPRPADATFTAALDGVFRDAVGLDRP